MKKNVFYASWYLITLALTIFSMTILLTLQKRSLMYWVPFTTLAVLQGIGMTYYLHRDPQRTELKWLKFFLFLLRCSALPVAAALLIMTYSLACQYHNPVDVTANDGTEPNIAVQRADELYILVPQYDKINFATGTRPSKSDGSVLLCCAATFDGRAIHSPLIIRSLPAFMCRMAHFILDMLLKVSVLLPGQTVPIPFPDRRKRKPHCSLLPITEAVDFSNFC